MNVQEQIKKYITGQPEPKCSDMRELHRSRFKFHQNANYGSSMALTAKIILFPTLRLDMGLTRSNTPMEKAESFFRLVWQGERDRILHSV